MFDNSLLKNKIILSGLILSVFFLLPQPGHTRYKKTFYIGKINLNNLILLHPAMIYYDPVKKGFRKASNTPKDGNQLRAQKAKISRLENKIKRLRAKRKAIHNEYNRKMELISQRLLNVSEKTATATKALKEKQYQLDKNKISNKFQIKLRSIGGQILNTLEQIKELKSSSSNPGYTSYEETRQKIRSIIEEIKRYTQQVANKKGIQVVLNSGSSMPQMTYNNISNSPNFGKIFSLHFPASNYNDSAAVTGYYTDISSRTKSWLNFGNQILSPYQNQINNYGVFIGGVDLSSEVLTNIYRAYKINSNIGNAIIQTIK